MFLASAIADPDACVRKEGELLAKLATSMLETLRDPVLGAAMHASIECARSGDLDGLRNQLQESQSELHNAELAISQSSAQTTISLPCSSPESATRTSSSSASSSSSSSPSASSSTTSLPFHQSQTPPTTTESAAGAEAVAAAAVNTTNTTAINDNNNTDTLAPAQRLHGVHEGKVAFMFGTVRELLQPGHSFQGNIKIPISESAANKDLLQPDIGKRTPYALHVLRTFTDERGEEQILVKHAAHDDEQVCVLTLGSDADGAQITFNDMETFCQGRASLEAQELTGTVRQLQHGMEEFPLEGEKDVHTFHLKLESSSASQRPLLVKLREKQERFVLTFAMHRLLYTRASAVGRATGVGRSEFIPSAEVCKSFFDMMSTLNAMLLRQANALNKVSFPLQETRDRLTELAAQGFSRAQAHTTCDGLLRFLTAVNSATYTRVRSESARTAREFQGRMVQIDYRSHQSYQRFDSALRAAEKRITRETLQRHCVSSAALSQDASCCICLEELCDSSEVIALPNCAHSLHLDCAARWYWLCDTCPQCRQQFNAAKAG